MLSAHVRMAARAAHPHLRPACAVHPHLRPACAAHPHLRPACAAYPHANVLAGEHHPINEVMDAAECLLSGCAAPAADVLEMQAYRPS